MDSGLSIEDLAEVLLFEWECIILAIMQWLAIRMCFARIFVNN